VIDAKTTTLCKWAGKAGWKRVATLSYRAAGNMARIDDIMIIEFSTSGDSGPDRRFNYHYAE
jgi:hypothetical protein